MTGKSTTWAIVILFSLLPAVWTVAFSEFAVVTYATIELPPDGDSVATVGFGTGVLVQQYYQLVCASVVPSVLTLVLALRIRSVPLRFVFLGAILWTLTFLFYSLSPPPYVGC